MMENDLIDVVCLGLKANQADRIRNPMIGNNNIFDERNVAQKIREHGRNTRTQTEGFERIHYGCFR